jgi:hypothetical protein
MDTLHYAADHRDHRPTVAVLVDTRYDLQAAGLLEDADPNGVANADVADVELDAREERNERLVDAYERAYLESLTEVARERDLTLQVSWQHCAAVDFRDDEQSELAQAVYQAAHDRTSVVDVRAAAA